MQIRNLKTKHCILLIVLKKKNSYQFTERYEAKKKTLETLKRHNMNLMVYLFIIINILLGLILFRFFFLKQLIKKLTFLLLITQHTIAHDHAFSLKFSINFY